MKESALWICIGIAGFSLAPITILKVLDLNAQALDERPAERRPARSPPAELRDDAPKFLGVLRAGETVEVAPKFEGKLEAVLLRPGDRVRRGTRLASLDSRAMAQDLVVARAELAEANARATEANARLRRRNSLSRFSGITKEELEEAKAHAKIMQAQLAAHHARVVQLEHNLEEAELRAPFDGVVATCYASAGALVGPTRPVLRLLSEGDLEVRFAVPEERAREVAIADPVHIELEGLDTEVHGAVISIAPEIDSGSHMIFATAKLNVDESRRGRLVSGTVVRVVQDHSNAEPLPAKTARAAPLRAGARPG